jgi:hypothetical protein
LCAKKQRTTYRSDPAVHRDYEAIDTMTAQRAIRFLRVRQVASTHAARDSELLAGTA